METEMIQSNVTASQVRVGDVVWVEGLIYGYTVERLLADARTGEITIIADGGFYGRFAPEARIWVGR